MSHPVSSAPAAAPLDYAPGFRARRAQNWIFLGLMYGFFYMSRYNFSAISVAIGERFGWSNADYGKVVSAGVLVYGLSVFLNGPLADRIGGKRAILIGSVGAALFNLLFGLAHLFLATPAVVKNGVVVTPAVYAHGMTASTVIATMSVLWASNHYFQSFGALSIVKINAAWFHVSERGKFAGIFGIMIQSGRTFAFFFSPFILRFLPWQWCFWIPAAILAVMFVANWRFVANTPADAGFDFHTADETREEAAQKPSLGFVLRKVFASPAMWLIAAASMCIGMVRNSIDHWWARYIGTVFHLKAAELPTFQPYNVASWGMPLMAIAGGLAAGNASDRLFGSRRAPVIFFAFVGQAVTLVALAQGLRSPWLGCLLLLCISFFIQAAHSLVGGAASMDFGGKKAVATAAGLFDGAQYLAGTLVGYGMGRLLDAYKDARAPGAEYGVWPYAPLPFALVGALLIARLWNAVPGRVAQETTAEALARRTRVLGLATRVQRLVLGAYGLGAGALALLTVLVPQIVARESAGHSLPASALLLSQLMGAARLGLAVVALVTATLPRPPKALVRALVLALTAAVVAPLVNAALGVVPWREVASLRPWLWLDGLVALALGATDVVRATRATLPAGASAAAADAASSSGSASSGPA